MPKTITRTYTKITKTNSYQLSGNAGLNDVVILMLGCPYSLPLAKLPLVYVS